MEIIDALTVPPWTLLLVLIWRACNGMLTVPPVSGLYVALCQTLNAICRSILAHHLYPIALGSGSGAAKIIGLGHIQ